MEHWFCPLLELPLELRLMIYEFLPITTRHHTLEDPDFERRFPEATSPSEIVLVTKAASTKLLPTCRQIYYEYKPVLEKSLHLLRSEPLRFIVHSTSLAAMMNDRIVPHIPKPGTGICTCWMCSPAPTMEAAVPNAAADDPVQRDVAQQFAAKCAQYADTRSPSSIVVAIHKHTAHDIRRISQSLRVATYLYDQHERDFVPLTLALHGTKLEDVYATPNPTRGVLVILHNPSASVSVDELDEEEWDRVWEQGDVLLNEGSEAD